MKLIQKGAPPKQQGQQLDTQQNTGQPFMEKLLGGRALPVAGATVGTVGGSIFGLPGRAAMGALGGTAGEVVRSTGESLYNRDWSTLMPVIQKAIAGGPERQLINKVDTTETNKNIGSLGKEALAGTGQGVADWGIGKALNTITGGPAAAALNEVKGLTPPGVQSGIYKAQQALGSQIDELLKEVPGKTVDVSSIISNLKNYKKVLSNQSVPKGATKAVDEIITRVGKYGNKITPSQAWDLKKGLTLDVFTAKGEEKLLSAHISAAKKAAAKTAYFELRDQLPEIAKGPLEVYGKLSQLGIKMREPIKGIMTGGIIGMISGNPAAIPAYVAIKSPYTQTLGKKALLGAAGVAKRTIPPALNAIFGDGQQ